MAKKKKARGFIPEAVMQLFRQWGKLGGLLGGSAKSDAKARAARANGKLGGRPRKKSKPKRRRQP
jgi:hypothetical protein